MKIKQILWHHRNDYTAEMECEHCGHVQKDGHGYSDANYYERVIPAMLCQHCGKRSDGEATPATKAQP